MHRHLQVFPILIDRYLVHGHTLLWTNNVSLFRFGHVMCRFRLTRGRLPGAPAPTPVHTRGVIPTSLDRWFGAPAPHVFLYLLSLHDLMIRNVVALWDGGHIRYLYVSNSRVRPS